MAKIGIAKHDTINNIIIVLAINCELVNQVYNIALSQTIPISIKTIFPTALQKYQHSESE